ncbi:MAG: hypothetical protein CVV22_08225 [Ignavibacteriae bacterium HGW-Ignavibacteriae-1]|jgi:two-component system cell cycle response regulator|nr:MAG: hypothetical protein CVV22_08225 [Ignavibacteriae bacterium HGW-Ignavibacteriae-1]
MNRPYVLVVDDNKITTKLLKRYLEANGYEAGEAFDGIECLEKVDARMPDAIVLDVMMPRMDGYETVSKLKENDATRHIPVVIVTALNDIPNQLKSIESGGDDFLSKPIEEKLLVAKVKLMTNLNLAHKELIKYKSLVNDLVEGKISKDDAKKALEL